MTCENCGKENRAGAIICLNCGRLLPQQAGTTNFLGDTDFEDGFPKWGSARFNPSKLLVLSVEGEKDEFAFKGSEIEDVVVGRADPDRDFMPPVDLNDVGGADKGVSRRHARIIRRDGSLHVIDLDSSNGTFLNGQRLVADQPRILRDGDELRLGHLVIKVEFRSPPQQSSAD